MTTSPEGKNIIKEFEGLRLDAYRCPAGVPTIGWGHTKGVKMGQKITIQQAEDMLVEDIAPCERILNALGINFRQEQFDALASWLFNLGETNFKGSTLLKRIAADATDEDITDQIIRWDKAAGRPMAGLMRRRCMEANLFLGYERYKVIDGRIQKV